MNKVTVKMATTDDERENFIVLENNTADDYGFLRLFHFTDDFSCEDALSLCDLVANGKINICENATGSFLDIDVATINEKYHVVLACVDYGKSLHKVFGFDCKADAQTAYNLAQRYFELLQEAEDADEIITDTAKK